MQKGSHAVVTAVFVKARGIVCGEAVGKGSFQGVLRGLMIFPQRLVHRIDQFIIGNLTMAASPMPDSVLLLSLPPHGSQSKRGPHRSMGKGKSRSILPIHSRIVPTKVASRVRPLSNAVEPCFVLIAVELIVYRDCSLLGDVVKGLHEVFQGCGLLELIGESFLGIG
ncbi:hypothetical protein B296_00026005 [Ensete ventricosum]|uniref:Uncharacterized protein n=1 Tax=Ensete ventricosum TaxID=4639 RepID=A0A426XWK4_ENSVE|nr:hypothetical protein B296_00026005 [Ensete ventricosum]